MKKINGWKKIAGVAVAIAAVGAAGTVVMPYTYAVWAPAVSFSWAGENILDRLDNKLISLTIAKDRAVSTNDDVGLRSVLLQIETLKRKIKEVETEQEKHKK